MANSLFESFWRFFRREPLVIFVLVGIGLFGAWRAWAPPDVATIRIEQFMLRSLEKQQEKRIGRPLTDEERAEVHEGYIEDEILLREAFERGFHRSDFGVRTRLTQMMRLAFTEKISDPSVAQLQAYFRENIDAYTTSESVTFEQVAFPWGEDVSGEELTQILDRLRSGADPEEYGVKPRSIPRFMHRQTRARLVDAFGADFADEIEELPAGRWHEPVESVQGVHLLRIVERHPPKVATFEDVRYSLREAWLKEQKRASQKDRIDEIRAGYRIIVEE